MTRIVRPASRVALAILAALACAPARAAEPVRIGITTILSGPIADRGQSEQYGAQLALDRINEAGGVLGRPVEAFYADNACKPDVGVPATKRLIEQEHVPVIIGALCTPVTHAIMPVIQQAKVPLVIATSAGQDFVDASGVGGNPYAFKTIPSEVDIARELVRWLSGRGIKSVAVVADGGGFFHANAVAFAQAARDGGLKVTAEETIPQGGIDFAALLATLKAGNPDALMTMFGPSTGGFFKAYEAAGWKVPVSGRTDLSAAANAVSAGFRAAGGLADMTAASVFSTAIDTPEVKAFVSGYRDHTGLSPTQRSFFVYEATLLVVDAIRRAGADTPEAIEAALKTGAMPSVLGGTYAMNEHNHPKLPVLILGFRDGKPAVIATE